MDGSRGFREEDYRAVEAEISALPLGQAFLRERDRRAQLVAVDEVRALFQGLREKLRPTSVDLQQRVLAQELQEMAGFIERTRQEIAALRPEGESSNWITTATEELDAIVSATEKATSDILGAAEHVQVIAGGLAPGETRAALEAQVIEIMTACSFQDITGQRTTKVVNALGFLERRIAAMIEIWGFDPSTTPTVDEPVDKRPDAHLLNGPSAGGVTQGDIDALFD